MIYLEKLQEGTGFNCRHLEAEEHFRACSNVGEKDNGRAFDTSNKTCASGFPTKMKGTKPTKESHHQTKSTGGMGKTHAPTGMLEVEEYETVDVFKVGIPSRCGNLEK